MTVLCRVFYLIVVFAGLMATGRAQSPAVGGLAGRVIDARSKSPLPGAEIRVGDGLAAGATELSGGFRVPAVPAGNHAVTVTFLGYDAVTRTVVVKAGETTTLEVELGAEVITLGAFTVEGAREGQARALNQQKTAGNLKNIIAADAIGHFPDKNVAESLQRVPGVSTVSLRGEANYVTIRGAAPGWNSVSLDGMSVPSANAARSDPTAKDMRSVQMDAFSSSQVGSIEVVKAVTPDLDGDSIGGAVLLKGRSAFDSGRRILGVSWAGSHNDLAEKSGYRATFNFSDVLGAAKDWGLSLSLSREKKTELEESNETNDWFALTTSVNGAPVTGFVPTTALQTYIYDIRRRDTMSAAVEKKVGDFGKLYLRGFQNKFDEKDDRYGLRFMPGLTAAGGNLDVTKPVTVGAGGTLTQFTSRTATARAQEQPQSFVNRVSGVIGGGSWQTGNWGLDGSASFSRATEDMSTVQGQWVSKSSANNATFDYSDPNFWRVVQNTGLAFSDPAGFGLNSTRWRNEFSKSEDYAGKLEASRVFQANQTPVKVHVGWKGRWNTKYDSNDVAIYGLMRTGTLDLNDNRLGGTVPVAPGFLGRRYHLAPFVSLASFTNFFEANRAQLERKTGLYVDSAAGLFVPNVGNTLSSTLGNDYKSHEDIHAAFARADWSVGPLGVIVGSRFERTDFDVRAIRQNTTVATTNPARYQPYRQAQDYDNWLPGLHLRYEARKNLIYRFAWTNTIARPGARDLIPNFSVDPINLTISGGNPDLRPVKSMNWDLSAEYYLSSIGVVSVGAFAKSVDGPTYASSTPLQYDAGGGLQRFTYNTTLNAGRATLRGLEFSYTQQLRFLPSPLDGLGIYTNYTVTDSEVDVPSRPGEKFPLFNQSRWLGNAAIFYQKYQVTARLAYNFRAGYLTTLLLPGTDTYWNSDHRLDFQLGYKVGSRWTVQFQANNLENTPERQYHGHPSRLEFYGLTGRFYSLGFNWEL